MILASSQKWPSNPPTAPSRPAGVQPARAKPLKKFRLGGLDALDTLFAQVGGIRPAGVQPAQHRLRR